MHRHAPGGPLAVLRGFFGLVYLTNGVAKIGPLRTLAIGPWKSFLIDFDSSRAILQSDVASTIAPYWDIVRSTVLPHYDLFGHIPAAAEIAVGLGSG